MIFLSALEVSFFAIAVNFSTSCTIAFPNFIICVSTESEKGTNLSNLLVLQKTTISDKGIDFVTELHESIIVSADAQVMFNCLPMDNRKLQYTPILLFVGTLRIIVLVVVDSGFESKIK
jgi:hypothetical protein